MDEYEYINRLFINNDLICKICQQPFMDPVVLPEPCEKIFCLECIKPNLENHPNSCPECNNRPLSRADLKNANKIVRQWVADLDVKCCACKQEPIKRIDFSKHAGQHCPKRIVFCSAKDIKCPWSGPYDSLQEHIDQCPYQAIRPTLRDLINEVQRLDVLDQLQIDFRELKNEYEQQKTHIQQIEKENETLQEQLNQLKTVEIEYKNLTEKSNKQTNDFNELTNENQSIKNQLEEEKKTKDNLDKELVSVKDSLQKANKSIEQLEEDKKTLQLNLDQLNEQYKESQKLAETLQEQQNECTAQISLYEKQFEELKRILIQSQYDNQNLNLQCSHYKTELNHLVELNQQLEQKITQYTTENQQLEQKITQYTTENQQLEQKITQYTTENQQLEQKITQYTTENQQLREESREDKIQIHELNDQIKRLEAKLNPPIALQSDLVDKSAYRNKQLEELIDNAQTSSLVNLNGETINDDDIDIVINTALITKQCQSLILSNNNLTENSIRKLSIPLSSNVALRILRISNNHLSDSAMKVLSEALKIRNLTLEELILSSNEISDQGLIYLSDMLIINDTLIVLGLQENKITDKSVKYLSNVIQFKNKVIKEISLYSNRSITDASVDDMANMLQNSQSLKRFWLWDCQISEKGIEKLQQSVQSKINFDLQLVYR